MKKFEIVVGVIAILSFFLKILHLPGSSILTVLSFSILAIFYYLGFAFFNNIRLREIFKSSSYQNTNAKRIIGAVGLGFALSTIIMGALFKIQLWPGGTFQLNIGLIVTALLFIIAVFFYLRNKTEYYIRIFKRIAIIGGLGFILTLTPSSTLVDIYFRDNPEYAELLKKVLVDPDNQEVREQLEQSRQKFHE